MKQKNKKIFGLIIGVLFLTIAGKAMAMMTAEELEAKKIEKDEKKAEIQAQKDAKKEEIETKKAEAGERRCEQIKERTRSRIERFEGNNKYHQKNFNAIKQNIQEIVALFKNQGIDTSNIENYLQTLQTKLDKLYADHASFITALQNSESIDCANIENQIKNKLQVAKQEGEVVKNDIIDVKNYYKDTVRPELIRLRQEYLRATGQQDDDQENAQENETEESETVE